MKIRKAIIPAAGLGTRFLPATKAQPKEMLPIVDKPTIQYIVEEAIASGIESIIIITGRNKRSIEDHFDKSFELEAELESKGKNQLLEEIKDISNLVDIHYIRQKEALGLGHAILRAKTFIANEPFAVLLGDDIVYNDEKPCLKQLMDIYDEYKTTVLGVQSIPWENVSNYGIVSAKSIEADVFKVKDLVEKPSIEEAPSNMAILGRYIITPSIFEHLEKIPPGSGGEIQLTDALRSLVKEEVMYAYDFKGQRYDVGNKMGFIEATIEYALRRSDLAPSVKKYLYDLLNGNVKHMKDVIDNIDIKL